MGENEASLPNTALQGKCQQPLKWLQSDMSVVSITEVCVCVCVCVCVLCARAPMLRFKVCFEGGERSGDCF